MHRALFVACLFLCAHAGAAEHLNIKTGLWEITSVTQTSGMVPLPKELLSKLTPEQQAKMRADMKADASKPTKDVARECVTQKDIERPFSTDNMEKCKQSIVATTRNTQEVRVVCEGELKGSGTLRISAPTAESMTGSMDLKLGGGTDTFTVKADLKGRWLGGDCGEEADEEDADDLSDDEEDSDENP